jgi:hypothetical protein
MIWYANWPKRLPFQGSGEIRCGFESHPDHSNIGG